MSNETPQDNMSEADLDDILSEAANLASNLKEEIGDSGDPAAAAAPDPINDVKTGTTDTVECELHELERLVASTAEQLGAEASDESDAEPGESTPTTAPADETASSETPVPEESASEAPVSDSPAAETSEQSKPLAVPDFMSEFTEPEAPQEVKPEAAATETKTAGPEPAADADADATATSVDDDPESDPKPGVVGSPIGQTKGDPSVESASESQALAEPESDSSATDSPKATASDALRALGQRLAPLGLAVCAKVVLLLEMIDRPLGRIGAAPRTLLGWLAIATLGMAAIVYVISLW